MVRSVSETAAPAAVASVQEKRRLGRPRRPSTDEQILRATLELLREGGPHEISMDAIAARSGSAKTTIYRRWPSLEGLIVDALRVAVRARMDQVVEIREFDEIHGSPIHGAARQILGLVREPLFRAAFPMMARALLGQPSLAKRFREEVFGPLRAIRRDELMATWPSDGLRPGIDPDLILDLVNGAILYRALMSEPLDEAIVDEIADILSRCFQAS
jgi:AcrR family transcriptional regulator